MVQTQERLVVKYPYVKKPGKDVVWTEFLRYPGLLGIYIILQTARQRYMDQTH